MQNEGYKYFNKPFHIYHQGSLEILVQKI